MGRPWWYDSYWEKRRPVKRRFNLPGRRNWIWIAIVIVSILLGMNSTGFHLLTSAWLVGSVYYFCRILTFAIIIRAILSWFMVDRRNLLISILDDITEPVLSPLRRVVPRLGMFDITPIVAIIILYLIPLLFSALL